MTSMTIERSQVETELTGAQAFVAAQQLIYQQNRYEQTFDNDYANLDDVAYRFVLDGEVDDEPVAVVETRRNSEGNVCFNKYRLRNWVGALAASVELNLTTESIDRICTNIDVRAPGSLM